MTTVRLSSDAKEDLKSIRTYILEELDNPTAAKNVIDQIIRRMRQLEQFPNHEHLIILPDKVFFIRKDKVGLIDYADFQIVTTSQKFVENDPVPKDATVVDYTWQYVNKDGSPDKRFNNNRDFVARTKYFDQYNRDFVARTYNFNTMQLFC